MKARIILAAAALFVTSEGFAADPQYIGQALPEAAAAGGTHTLLPDWDGIALDGLSDKVIRNALAKTMVDQGALATRGSKEIGIYRTAAPSVVLIITADDSLGSGSYLGDGQILTNRHVVGTSKMVGVLFKPAKDGGALDLKGLVRADVLRTDQAHDLALLKLAVIPPGLKPLELGNPSEIQVGADVHAIGHPTGQAWTYTKGLISQVRNDFEWKGKDEKAGHRANVIQTQTPISPGSSGGPLLGDSGKILGVNSFKDLEGENLNFAVSVVDVAAFVQKASADPGGRVAPAPPSAPKCAPVRMFDGRNRPNDARLVQIDTNCDGVADFSILTPDDKTQPIRALIDSNFDGKIDIIVEDTDRDGRWDISFHDVDFDGTIDMVGYHPDGKLKPSRYERYAEGLAKGFKR
jgi:S1-C subfamily serine protease